MEAVDVGMWVGRARRDGVDADATRGTPLETVLCQERRAVVDANGVWEAMQCHQVSQDARDTGGG